MTACADKVAFITGASSGIGAALAREWARQKGDVVLAARRLDRLQELEAEIAGLGRRALSVQCDVTVDGDLERAVAQAVDAFGGIDVAVANAGFGVAKWFHKLELSDYRRQLETNVFGVVRTAYACREQLVKRRGVLAIMGSVAGYVALPGTSPYSMSKAAVHSLAGSLYYELGSRGVAVVLLAPGFIDSEIRKIDNRGVLHPEYRDPIPPWLRLDTETAARRMVKAIRRRRRVQVFTLHGHLAVSVQRHAPWLLAGLMRRFGVRERSRSET